MKMVYVTIYKQRKFKMMIKALQQMELRSTGLTFYLNLCVCVNSFFLRLSFLRLAFERLCLCFGWFVAYLFGI